MSSVCGQFRPAMLRLSSVSPQDGSGSVLTDDLKRVFTDLFPGLNKWVRYRETDRQADGQTVMLCVVPLSVLHRNMLETFLSDELRAADRTFSRSKTTFRYMD